MKPSPAILVTNQVCDMLCKATEIMTTALTCNSNYLGGNIDSRKQLQYELLLISMTCQSDYLTLGGAMGFITWLLNYLTQPA